MTTQLGTSSVRGAVMLLAVAAAAAGCGGGTAKVATATAPSASSASAAASGSGAREAAVATHSGPLGAYLTDAQGRTLYLFVADKASKSVCYGKCATYWPPLTTTHVPLAKGAAKRALLGTTKRTGGGMQVTYAGHPLYYFLSDKAAGDMKGQGVNANGGLWWMLTPAGASITKKAPTAAGSPSQTPSAGSAGSGTSGGGWS